MSREVWIHWQQPTCLWGGQSGLIRSVPYADVREELRSIPDEKCISIEPVDDGDPRMWDLVEVVT